MNTRARRNDAFFPFINCSITVAVPRIQHTKNPVAEPPLRRMAECGTRCIVLAHLSRENNTPQRALAVMETALSGLDVTVEVAPRGELSACYGAEVALCRK